MKLLYLANVRMPTEKAHGLQILKTCEAFARRGAKVELVVPRRRNALVADPFAYYGVERIFSVTRRPTIDAVYLGPLGFWLQSLTFFLGALPHVARAGADAIYSRDMLSCVALSLLGFSVVYEDHEPRRNKTLYAFMLRRIPRKVVVARHLLRLYEELGVPTERVLVAPNGVDTYEFDRAARDPSLWQAYGIPAGRRIVLYVGHFYRWKGIYTLLDSSEYVSDEAHLVCIGGTTEDRRAVEEYVRVRGLSNVRLIPFMPHSDVVRYIKSADVLVLPNTAEEERSARYTTPLKLFEYMASGVPIVASRIPSIELYLADGENALLTKPDDPGELASGIRRALSDLEASRRVGARAKEEARAYSWESRSRTILEFIARRGD